MQKEKEIQLRTGDIFCVALDDAKYKFFQFTADDNSGLSANIIRVFKKSFVNQKPDWDELSRSKVDFYARCNVVAGIKSGLWTRAGHSKNIGKTDIFFKIHLRETANVIHRREGWYKWQINKPLEYIGERLSPEEEAIPLGEIYPAQAIYNKIKTGNSGFPYF